MKIVVSNKLLIYDPPPEIEADLFHLCKFNTSAFADQGAPTELDLFEKFKDHISVPRGFLDLVKNRAKDLGVHVVIETETKAQQFDFKINPKINYTSGVYGYQAKTVQEALKHHTGRIQAPTGSGKTALACLTAAVSGEGPVLFLANKDRLLKQFVLAANKILDIPEEEIGIIKAAKFKIKPITCGSLQTLGKESFNINKIKNQFATVFYDECHLSTAITYRRVLLGLAPKRLIGLSATPEHYSSLDLNYLMDGLLGPIIVKLTEDDIPGRLVPETYSRQTGEIFTYKAAPDAKEFIVRKCRHAMFQAIANNEHRNNLIVDDAIRLYKHGHKLLIISNRVFHARVLFEKLSAAGVPCSFPYNYKTDSKGEEKATVNHKKLDDDVFEVQKGNISCILGTYTLFDTGFDCQPLSALLMVAPFSGSNTTRLEQCVGRVLRYLPDKATPVVLDYQDTSTPYDVLGDWGRKRENWLKQKYQQHYIVKRST